MRAVEYSPEAGLRLVEVDTPTPAPDEVVLRVEACGVCGSDRQVVQGESVPQGTSFPVILGHEVAGTVIDRGANALDWHAGDSVIVHPFMACGACGPCMHGEDNLCIRQGCIGYTRPGGFAEQVAVPAIQLVRRPPSLAADAAALLVDAYATPYRALVEAGMVAGCTVLVIGTGGLGLATLQLLRAFGAKSIGVVSRREAGVNVAEGFGAHLAVSTETDVRTVSRALRRWSGGGGIDIVVDTVGDAASVSLAFDVVRAGGTIGMVGMSPDVAEIPVAKWVRRGVRIIGSYGSRKSDVAMLVRWVDEGRFDPAKLIGARIALSAIETAFSSSRSFGRTVVLPNAQ